MGADIMKLKRFIRLKEGTKVVFSSPIRISKYTSGYKTIGGRVINIENERIFIKLKDGTTIRKHYTTVQTLKQVKKEIG